MNKAFNFSFHSSTTLLYYKDNNYEQKYILKTSVFNFCGSMLPGFADFNAKNNKKNLHDCNEYMNNDELRNTLKFSQLSRYAKISKPQLNCHVTPNQLHGCTQYTYFAADNRSMVHTVTTIPTI